MGFPLFERHMRRRFYPLLAQALVLDLLLMLNLALFLFAFEGHHFVGVELLVREQVFIYKERRPRVRRGVARLLGREMGVFPVGQLLTLGDLLAETDGVDLLQP